MIANQRLGLTFALVSLFGAAAGCSAPAGESTGSGESGEGVTQEELTTADESPKSDEDGVEPDATTDGDDVARLFGTGETTTGDTTSSALSTCRNTLGYRGGAAFTICVTALGRHLVEVHTADAFTSMQSAARRDGVNIAIVSGFRSMEQQRYLYGLYRAGRGNLAAVPGFSNHQSGHALDLNTSGHGVYAWLERHGATFGFRRTVPSEIWHWEVWGSGTGRTVSGGGAGCHSNTLGRTVVANSCVQSASNSKWYQCHNGTWVDRWTDPQACVAVYPR